MDWVNSQNVRQLWVPLAGMEESGMGREGGHDSFDFYTEQKTVHVPLGAASHSTHGRRLVRVAPGAI